MPGKKTRDEIPENSITRFKTQVFNVVYDQVVSSLNNRFERHGDLYKEISLLDPRYVKENLPENSFNWMSSKLAKFNSEITAGKLHSEMQDFIRKWPKLKLIDVSIEDNNYNIDDDAEVENVDQDTYYGKCIGKKACQNCLACCYRILYKYNLHSSAYSFVYLMYKFVLTLSCTQIRCETTFSKLKYVLNRLRNCLSQSKLETFLIMSVKKDILMSLDNESIIDKVFTKSCQLSESLNF